MHILQINEIMAMISRVKQSDKRKTVISKDEAQQITHTTMNHK
jgi:plasmid replication initiation protein